MKNKIKYFLLSIVIIFTGGCDYLDKEPDNMLTLEMVFRDKTRTEDWLAGIYNAIPKSYMPSLKDVDALADDFAPSPGWEPYGWGAIPKIKGNWSSSTGWSANYWDRLPQKIRSAYIFIENVQTNEAQLITAQEVEYMKAECKFLIAYYYYLLLNYYGSIPLQIGLTDTNTAMEQLMIGQTPYDEVVDWIDKELLQAASVLPPYYNEARKYGRATSIMCHAVRARMLLFAASPLVNGNPDYKDYVNDKGEPIFNSTYDPSKWEKATKACKELIDLAEKNGHRLYYEYNDDGTIDPFMSYMNMSFKRYDEGNKELLFVRPSAGNNPTDDSYDYDKHAQPRGTGGNGGLGVSQTLVDAFFMKNGLPPITGYKEDGSPIINEASGYSEKGFSTEIEKRKTKWIEVQGSKENLENPVTLENTFNMYCNREPRFYISVLYNECWFRRENRRTQYYMNAWDGGPTHDAPQNGYLLRKRVHPDHDPRNNTRPYRPGILYRLGEAYLNYAEALNESSPGNPDIVKYVNLIRERAGIPVYGSGAGEIPVPATQDEMRLAIRRERRVELNCEAEIRYNDVRRWKTAEKELDGTFYGMNYYGKKNSDDINDPEAFFVRTPYLNRVFTLRNYWIPVPQSQIDKNPNLRQTPGW